MIYILSWSNVDDAWQTVFRAGVPVSKSCKKPGPGFKISDCPGKWIDLVVGITVTGSNQGMSTGIP